jgi:hypothetical protein
MTKNILTILFLAIGITSFGQINMVGSTVQVITHWKKGEKQDYALTVEKIQLKGTDTISRKLATNDVEITVLKQRRDSYTIQWLYKSIKTNNAAPTTQQLMNIAKDMKVIYKIDELGAFQELTNWKELRKYFQKTYKTLREKYKASPEMDKLITQIEETFLTKEAIEIFAIKDIQHFHSFHGAEYKLGEILETEMEYPNLFGTYFDVELTECLDEINKEDDNYVMKASREINREQLINTTFEYLTKTLKNINVTMPITHEDLKDLKNEILTTSRIHGTGWVIYSVQTTVITVMSDNMDANITTIEKRIIKRK